MYIEIQELKGSVYDLPDTECGNILKELQSKTFIGDLTGTATKATIADACTGNALTATTADKTKASINISLNGNYFNNPFGACPTCAGLGYKMEFDLDLMISILIKNPSIPSSSNVNFPLPTATCLSI